MSKWTVQPGNPDALPQVDENLRDFLQDPGSEKDKQLEQMLLRSGGADESVKVWKERGVVVDGHRRMRLCQRLGLPFECEELSFADELDVKIYMLQRQDSRRNNDPVEEARCAALLAELIAKRDGGSYGKGVSKKVAEATGTNEETVKRNIRVGKIIESMPPEIQAKIRTGDITASKDNVERLNRMPDKAKKAALKKLSSGKVASVAEVLPRRAKKKVSPDKKAGEPAEPKVADLPDSEEPRPKIKPAHAPMPEAYVDERGNDVPDELIPVFRRRGHYDEASQKLEDVIHILGELGKDLGCQTTAGIAEDLQEIQPRIQGAMPAVAHGTAWLSRSFVQGKEGAA